MEGSQQGRVTEFSGVVGFKKKKAKPEFRLGGHRERPLGVENKASLKSQMT